MNYLIVINDRGKKETAYVLGLHGERYDDLLSLAKTEFPDRRYIEDDGTLFSLLTPSKIYLNGDVLDDSDIEIEEVQSVAEVMQDERRTILEEYKEKERSIKDRLLTAFLHDDDESIAEIQDEFLDVQRHYTRLLAKGAL